jgi:dTDP-4-dehydrorhamnose reductase
MLLLQVAGGIVVSIGYMIFYGLGRGTTWYLTDMTGIMAGIDLATLLVMGLWYYLAFGKRQKAASAAGRSRFTLKSAALIFCMAISLQFLIGILLTVWQLLFPQTIASYSQMMEDSGVAQLNLLSVVLTVILAPVSEEITFRGLTMKYLKRAGAPFLLANVIQALFFGIAHMNLVQGVYAFLLGLVCGWIAEKFKTIRASVLFHMIFNGYATFMDPVWELLYIPDVVYILAALVLGIVLFAVGMRGLRGEGAKRLLVTGGSGFLGSRIVRHYEGSYQVLVPRHGELDICDAASVTEYFRRKRPDLVVHCAGVSDTAYTQEHPQEAYRINVEGTQNLAQACAQTGAKLIYCSSDQVYFGSDSEEAHREDESLVPAGEYGRQKLEAEERCQSICPDSVGLRLCWMYDTARLSEREHGNFMVALLEAIRENRELTYPVHDYRGITDVNLVVEKMEQAFALPGGIYNFGSENSYNTYETVRMLLEQCGYRTGPLHSNETAFAEKPRNIRVNMEKAASHGIVFPQTLERLVWVLKNQTGAKEKLR